MGYGYANLRVLFINTHCFHDTVPIFYFFCNGDKQRKSRGRRLTMEIKKIQTPSRRKVTFYKRRRGLLKKACEISVLCGVEVALIIFSESGRLYEFASSEMDAILRRYNMLCQTPKNTSLSYKEIINQHNKFKMEALKKKIDALELKQKNIKGEEIEKLSLKQLDRLEKQIRISQMRLYQKKIKILFDNIKFLEKEIKSLQHDKIKLINMVSCDKKEPKENNMNEDLELRLA